MRTYLGSLVVALGVTAAAPVLAAASTPDESTPNPAVAVEQVRVPFTGLRDEAAMVLVGTALIGLAAAVRRSA
jgi:hypothetical protein